MLNPIATGVVWVLTVYVVVARRPVVSPDDAVLGKSAAEVANRVAVHYAGEIARIGVVLAALALAFGVLLGLVASALIALRAVIRGTRLRLTGPRAAADALGLVVTVHVACVAWWMATCPQIYSPTFWQRGGALATVQRFVTDRAHPGGVVVLSIAVLVVWLFGAPWRWPTRAMTLAAGVARRWRVLAVATALGATIALLASPPRLLRAASARSSRPNIVVLASDGLRADRLGPRVTPRLDALASRGTRFERAYASLPRTLPSWLTLLTGQYPHHHGVRSDFVRWEHVSRPFDALPRRLASDGYATAVVSDYAGDIFGRIDVGFDVKHIPPSGFVTMIRQAAVQHALPVIPVLQSRLGRRLLPDVGGMMNASDPEMVADDAIRVMRSMEDRPFFLVVFFSTTHFPYASPYPDYARFVDPAYDGAYRYEKTLGLGSASDASPEDARQTRALYDGAAYATDRAAGRVLDAIGNDGLSDRTIVVVTSDHGENLYENDHGQGHGDHLFGDEGTHVPLVVYDPRASAPHVETAVVQTVDLTPTVCDLAGVAPPAAMDGRSLAAGVRGAPLASLPAYAETELWLLDDQRALRNLRVPTPGVLDLLEVDAEHGQQIVTKAAAEPLTLLARHRMVRDDRWKLVYAPTTEGVRYELFDTRSDPEERADVSQRVPAETARLQDLLWPWMLGDPGVRRVGDYVVPLGFELETLLPHGAR
ncbi:MAG TPA: sulfatase [Polyangiaceae bacterium]